MIWIFAWYFILSVITFAIYGLDKRKAKLTHWRIKENTLHLLDLLGGWPGGLAAQHVFHHKTRKTQFQLVFWAIVIVHLAGWTYIICQYLKGR